MTKAVTKSKNPMEGFTAEQKEMITEKEMRVLDLETLMNDAYRCLSNWETSEQEEAFE